MPHRKKNYIDEEEDEVVEESWDFKKLLIGFITVVVIVIGGYYFLASQITTDKTRAVLSTFIKNDPAYEEHKQRLIESSQKDAVKLLEKVKDDVAKITADNVGTSTEDIDAIIKNLQALQGKSKEPADIVCEYFCKK